LDDVLGVFLLVLYIVGIVSLACAVTYAAIKLFPTKSKPDKKKDDEAPPPSDDGAGAGRLFRRSKREATS
jgi:hypothetical protein